MRRLEIERKLQVDQRQIFATATPDRSAQPIKGFCGAGLRRIGKRRQFISGPDFLHFLQDHRMIWNGLVELLIDF